MYTQLRKIIASFIILTFSGVQIFQIYPTKAYAQSVLDLPAPGVMVTPTTSFIPAVMKGIKIFPNNPLRFDFIIDTGNAELEDETLETESSKLIKYFLVSLTVPEDELWVNLSPYEKDRIIPDKFGVTEMGRDLLAQDYVLKQLTASLIYPEEDLGSEFWDRVYAKANELYGTSEVPVNTFNKVWVVPEKATIYESGDIAFIVESHLKVMLEGDYIALKENMNNEEMGTNQLDADKTKELSDVSSEIIREVILPEIEKEVNKGQNFLSLRQIYNSMILATWFKRNLRESLLGQVYVEKNKVSGVDIEDKQVREKIYQQYLEAFKVGVYDYIKEDYDPATQEIISRKYFSGGMEFRGEMVDEALSVEPKSRVETLARVEETTDGSLKTVSAYLETVRNLEKEIRLIRRAARKNSEIFGEITNATSIGQMMDALILWLEKAGLIVNRDEIDGNELIVISDEAKRFELGRLLSEGGLNNMGVIKGAAGIKMNNYRRPNGEYRIIGFESESTQKQIGKEVSEIKKRRDGKHQLEAFVLTAQEAEGEEIEDYESLRKDAEKMEAGRQDEISASTAVASRSEFDNSQKIELNSIIAALQRADKVIQKEWAGDRIHQEVAVQVQELIEDLTDLYYGENEVSLRDLVSRFQKLKKTMEDPDVELRYWELYLDDIKIVSQISRGLMLVEEYQKIGRQRLRAASAKRELDALAETFRKEGPRNLLKNRPAQGEVEAVFRRITQGESIDENDMRVILRQTVYETRTALIRYLRENAKYKGLLESLEEELSNQDERFLAGDACGGYCEIDQIDVNKRVMSLSRGEVNLLTHHAEVLFGGNTQHAFVVAKNEYTGKTYLVDPTLRQFFTVDDGGALDKKVGQRMRGAERELGVQKIDKLLSQGYVELDDDIVFIYQQAFGEDEVANFNALKSTMTANSTNTGNYGAIFSLANYTEDEFRELTPAIARQRAELLQHGTEITPPAFPINYVGGEESFDGEHRMALNNLLSLHRRANRQRLESLVGQVYNRGVSLNPSDIRSVNVVQAGRGSTKVVYQIQLVLEDGIYNLAFSYFRSRRLSAEHKAAHLEMKQSLQGSAANETLAVTANDYMPVDEKADRDEKYVLSEYSGVSLSDLVSVIQRFAADAARSEAEPLGAQVAGDLLNDISRVGIIERDLSSTERVSEADVGKEVVEALRRMGIVIDFDDNIENILANVRGRLEEEAVRAYFALFSITNHYDEDPKPANVTFHYNRADRQWTVKIVNVEDFKDAGQTDVVEMALPEMDVSLTPGQPVLQKSNEWSWSNEETQREPERMQRFFDSVAAGLSVGYGQTTAVLEMVSLQQKHPEVEALSNTQIEGETVSEEAAPLGYIYIGDERLFNSEHREAIDAILDLSDEDRRRRLESFLSGLKNRRVTLHSNDVRSVHVNRAGLGRSKYVYHIQLALNNGTTHSFAISFFHHFEEAKNTYLGIKRSLVKAAPSEQLGEKVKGYMSIDEVRDNEEEKYILSEYTGVNASTLLGVIRWAKSILWPEGGFEAINDELRGRLVIALWQAGIIDDSRLDGPLSDLELRQIIVEAFNATGISFDTGESIDDVLEQSREKLELEAIKTYFALFSISNYYDDDPREDNVTFFYDRVRKQWTAKVVDFEGFRQTGGGNVTNAALVQFDVFRSPEEYSLGSEREWVWSRRDFSSDFEGAASFFQAIFEGLQIGYGDRAREEMLQLQQKQPRLATLADYLSKTEEPEFLSPQDDNLPIEDQVSKEEKRPNQESTVSAPGLVTLEYVERKKRKAQQHELPESNRGEAAENDSAALGETDETVGGIDLNPNMLELQTQGRGIDFNIPINPQVIQSIQIDGFSPVIFQIVPTNLPMLMGLSDEDEERKLFSRLQ